MVDVSPAVGESPVQRFQRMYRARPSHTTLPTTATATSRRRLSQLVTTFGKGRTCRHNLRSILFPFPVSFPVHGPCGARTAMASAAAPPLGSRSTSSSCQDRSVKRPQIACAPKSPSAGAASSVISIAVSVAIVDRDAPARLTGNNSDSSCVSTADALSVDSSVRWKENRIGPPSQPLFIIKTRRSFQSFIDPYHDTSSPSRFNSRASIAAVAVPCS